MTVKNTRPTNSPADPLFVNRWSTRRYLNDPIPKEHIDALFEAARWAPSCFNEQPWLFVIATSEEQRQNFLPILVEKNQQWAKDAPLIGIIFSRNNFEKNGKPNRWAGFDTGAAWLSLALQAEKLGYSAHGMGGFSQDKAHEILNVPQEKFNAIAAFTVGKVDPATDEETTTRKETDEFVFNGQFEK